MTLLVLLFNIFIFPQQDLPTTQNDSSYVVVNDILIQGNERTKSSIILRELTFKLGDTLSTALLPAIIARNRSNIFNTNLFVTAEVSEVTRLNDQVIINITVKERWYLIVLPVFGLADRNFNEWWYERDRDFRRITYGIQATHSNLTGNADELKVKAYGGFVPYFELAYSKPYIDKRQRLGVVGGVYYSTQRTMAFRTWKDKLDFINTEERMREQWGGFTQLNFRNALYHSHSLFLGFSKSVINDTILKLNPNYFLGEGNTQRYTQLSYQYTFDKRDNYQYALKGQVVQASITKSGLFKSDDVDQLNVSALYVRYFPIVGKLYGDFSIRGKISLPKLQPYTLTGGLGYKNALVRGYDLYVIDGQDYGLLKTNLKYQLFNKTLDISRIIKIKQFNTLPLAAYITAYGDIGYAKNYFPEFSNTRLGNRRLTGGGVGMDFVTFYDTIIRLNYSFNQLGESKFFFTIVRNL